MIVNKETPVRKEMLRIKYDKSPVVVGSDIKRLMERIGLSLESLARRLGIRVDTMRRWVESRQPKLQRHHIAIMNSLCVRRTRRPLALLLAD